MNFNRENGRRLQFQEYEKKNKARKMPDAKQPIYSQKGNSFYNKTVMEARFNY